VAFLAPACVVACTFVNAVDAVKPQLEGSTGPADGAAEAAAADVDQPGSDGGADAGPPKGVIVIGGSIHVDGGVEHVLTALAPENGLELPHARQTLTVAGVVYDGLRDLWYVFESGGAGFFPLPTDPTLLHVRRLDTRTGQWEELQTQRVPSIVSYTHIGVLRERLVYIAYRRGSEAGLAQDMVTLNTAEPNNVTVLSTQPLEQPVKGLIATRSTNQSGGGVNLLRDVPCGDAGQCLQIQHVTVSAQGAPAFGSRQELGKIVGTPAYGSFLKGGVDVVGFKSAFNSTAAPFRTYDPLILELRGESIPFNSNDAFLKPLAFAECLGQALVTTTNTDLAVYAIPLTVAGGKNGRGGMQHSGQGVYFEPFTSTALAPFSQGEGAELTAFRLTGTRAEPELVPRVAPDWTPPAEVRPEILATRQPLPVVCP
jgi:hypothetical protein